MDHPTGTPRRRPFTGLIDAVMKQENEQRLRASSSPVTSFSEFEEMLSEESERVQAAFEERLQNLPGYPSEPDFAPSTLPILVMNEDPTSRKEKRIQKLFREKSFGFVLLGVMEEAMPKKNEVEELEEMAKAIDAQKIIQNLQLTNYNLQKELWGIESKQATVENRLLVAFEDMTKTVMEALWTMYCIEMPEGFSIKFKAMMKEHMLNMNRISEEHQERMKEILQASPPSHSNLVSLSPDQVETATQTPVDRVSSDPRLISVLAQARAQVKDLKEGRIRRDLDTGRIRRD